MMTSLPTKRWSQSPQRGASPWQTMGVLAVLLLASGGMLWLLAGEAGSGGRIHPSPAQPLLQEGTRELQQTGIETLPPKQAPKQPPPPSLAEKALRPLLSGLLPMEVSGKVVDAGGHGVAGAKVEVVVNISRLLSTPLAGWRLASTTTNKSGAFLMRPSLGAGSTYLLHVRRTQLPEAWVYPIDPERPSTLVRRVVLAPSQRIEGLVQGPGGTPLPGARITLRNLEAPTRDPALMMECQVRSGSLGTFALEGVAPGRKQVDVELPGFAPLREEALTIQPRTRHRRLVFALVPGRDLEGRALDATTGAGLDQGWVRVRPLRRNGRGGRFAGGRTPIQGDGFFLLKDLAPGLYVLQAEAPGYAPAAGVNGRPGQKHLVLKLKPAATVSGHVLDGAGNPLPHATVVAGSWPDPSAAPWRLQREVDPRDGSFRLPVVLPGRKVYIFARAGGVGAGRAGPFELKPGQQLREVELSVSRGSLIMGRILDGRGRPLSGVQVSLLRRIVLPPRRHAQELKIRLLPAAMLARRQEVQSYPDGTFLALALEAGRYAVRVDAGKAFAPLQSEFFPVESGGEVHLPDLRLRKAAGIKGVVLDRHGEPDPAAIVNVVSMQRGGGSHSVRTDAAGRFAVLGLAPGSFRVVVVERGGKLDLQALHNPRRKPRQRVDLEEGEVQLLELKLPE